MPMYAVQCSNPDCLADEVYAPSRDVVELPSDESGYAGATVPCDCGQRVVIKPGGFIIEEFAFGGLVGGVQVSNRHEAKAAGLDSRILRVPPDKARQVARDLRDRNNEKVIEADRENRGRR